MSKISSSRIVEVFKTLSATATKAPASPPNSLPKKGSRKKLLDLHSEAALKDALRKRLSQLKASSENFEKEAPLVTIHEVMLWEFGDEILNHPSYKEISLAVTEQLTANETMKKHMANMIESILKA